MAGSRPSGSGDAWEGTSHYGALVARNQPTDENGTDDEVEDAFERLLDEGKERLERPLRSMLPTGTLGGIDIGVGILAYFVVREHTDDVVLAGIAFSIGFVALLLARSELFTENFLVPVTAVVAGYGTWTGLMRLWVATLVTNLVGGLIVMFILVTARPDLHPVMREAGEHYAELGVNAKSFALAVLAGLTITLMTRMQHSSDHMGVQVVPAILFGSVLAGGELFHCILDSLFMFAAMMAGGDVTIGQWLVALVWSAAGNIVGGVGLVTVLRLIRTAPRVREVRNGSPQAHEESTAG